MKVNYKLADITTKAQLLNLDWRELFDLRDEFLQTAEVCAQIPPLPDAVVKMLSENIDAYLDWYGDNIDEEIETVMLEWLERLQSSLLRLRRLLPREVAFFGWMQFQMAAIPLGVQGAYMAPVNVLTGDLSPVRIVVAKGAPRITLAGFYTTMLEELHLGVTMSSMHCPRVTEGQDL